MAKDLLYILNQDDEKTIELLRELGMPNNLAKTLVFLSNVGECQSRDIEQCTYLRQPEVSIATNYLLEREWLEKRILKKEGKGRPIHIFRSKINIPQVIEQIEQDINREYEKSKMDISHLKQIYNF